jgi:hypothetical protein
MRRWKSYKSDLDAIQYMETCMDILSLYDMANQIRLRCDYFTDNEVHFTSMEAWMIALEDGSLM